MDETYLEYLESRLQVMKPSGDRHALMNNIERLRALRDQMEEVLGQCEAAREADEAFMRDLRLHIRATQDRLAFLYRQPREARREIGESGSAED